MRRYNRKPFYVWAAGIGEAMKQIEKQDASISRRAALALAGSAPFVLTGKAQAVTLGSGKHTYEAQHDWAKLPASVQPGYTHGVVVNSQGQVLVHNRSKDAVIVFDENGKYVKSWGERFAVGAHGMQISKEGSEEFLYFSDPELHEISKYTLDGKEVFRLGVPTESNLYPDPARYKPTNIAVAPNGDFYVADGYGLSYIHLYNKKGEYQKSWGGKGTEPGKMSSPHGIAIDLRAGEPYVLVADRANVRLQKFTMGGEHIGFVTDELRYPCHFDFRGEEVLIPDLHGRVTIFDGSNKLLAHLGDYPDIWKQKGYPNVPHAVRYAGKFVSPHDACWDHAGNIFVVEWLSDGRITKLKRA